MSLLTSLAGRLAQVALVAPALARMKRRALRTAIGAGLMLVFGLFGLAYLLATFRIVLEPYLGPIWTPLAIGGGLMLMALIAYLVFTAPPRPARAREAAALGSAIPASLAQPIQQLESQVTRRPLESVALALAGGFAAAMILRMLRRPPAQSAQPAASPKANGHADLDAWVRDLVLREMDRRRADRQDARR